MDKVYLAYRESLLKAAPRMMEELGIETGEDFLGMGVFRKDVDLSNEEKQYLLSVERGDVPSTRQYLAQAKTTGMNLNCLDPLGRTALLVAIENENIEMIELLLSHGVEVGDALLHAINEENVEAVEMLLNHEIITKGEQQSLKTTVPSSSFTPDITPIILAGHRDNYEIIKILLDRGYRIPKPHNARCSCKDCIQGSQDDSLRHSRSRINAYKALASPSLICLSSKDPILTSFELSCELKQLSKLENEFKADYERLAARCQEFAVDLLEQTRGSRELAIVLNHDNSSAEEQNNDKVRLSRLKLAIKYKQKKFVSHPNCQQLLASMWYEGLPGFRRKSVLSKLTIMGTIGMMFPVLSFVYLVAPKCSIGQMITKPCIKFIIHCSSYLVFLFSLILVSQRVEVIRIGEPPPEKDGIKQELRGSQASLVEWVIMAYVAGLMWSEIKQLWDEGAVEYIHDMWNILDFCTNSLYIATFTLRLLAYLQVQEEKTQEGAELKDREHWTAYDPNLIAEALFAAANIFSSLKLVNIFTVSPYLGPLQISLGRMIMDIFKFGCIFMLVLVSFASGLNHLYWYYANRHAVDCAEWKLTGNGSKEDSCNRKFRSFANLFEIAQSLYWAIYGLVDLDHAELQPRFNHEFTEFVGKLMFGTYSWIALIVLLNMLIAMMSNSYQLIYSQADEEWKFARSKLWISYFEDSGTLPPPFNVIPSPKTFYYILRWCKDKLCSCFCSKQQKRNRWQSIKKIVKKINEKEIRYQAVMRDLIKRYIMQKQRGSQKGEGVTEDDINELKQDVSSFRFELLEILRNNGMKTPNPNQPKPTNRRLSRKRSHVSLDRMRRSMSLETCRVADHQDGGITSGLFAGRGGSDGDRQTSSLKLRCNPPETIPEEEMERIRRESLVPHVGLLAGDGRRRSSAVGLDGGGGGGGITANNKASAPKAGGKPDDGSVSGPGSRAGGRRSSTAVFSGGFKSAANAVLLPKPPEKASVFSKTAPATSSAAQKNSNNNLLSTTEIGRVSAPSPSTGDILSSTVFSDDIITLMAEDKHQGEDEGRAGSEASSCYSQRRDEGLGESFDRYSEISGYGNCSGGAGETLIELHTLNTNPGSSSAKPPSPPSSSSSSLSGTTKNSLQGQPIPGFPLDSTPLSAYPERPHQSPKNRNNNISKRKVSSSTSAPGEVRRKKSEDNSPDSDKAFVGVSRSLPLEGGEDSDHESSGGENGIDPLFFLSELQSKRVTFM